MEKTATQLINAHLSEAEDLAILEVERLARIVLSKNPKIVREFVMAMGSFFFCDKKDEIIHVVVGDNEEILNEMQGYEDLILFLDEFDERLKITGESMRFTHKGKKITKW